MAGHETNQGNPGVSKVDVRESAHGAGSLLLEASLTDPSSPSSAGTASLVANAEKRHSPAADRFFRLLAGGNAVLVLIVLVGIIGSLIIGSVPIFAHEGLTFYTSSIWNPVTEHFGAVTPIVDTLLSSVLALLIGVPMSFGIALFLTEVAPKWLAGPVGTAVELLAAIPSIIYGMWGMFIFAPLYGTYGEGFLKSIFGGVPVLGKLFSGPTTGIDLSTAGFILALMIVPFISSMMRDVFKTVPAVLKESAYGLGCTRWEVVRNIVLPYTRTGVVGAVMLGLGRALGETMAVTFIIGGSFKLPVSLFSPGATISSTIANGYAEADTPVFTSALTALGLTLFIITFVVLTAARLMLMQAERRTSH